MKKLINFVSLSKDVELARRHFTTQRYLYLRLYDCLYRNSTKVIRPCKLPYSNRQPQIICYHNFILSGMFHSNHDKGTCERYTLTKRLLERILPAIGGVENVLSFWVLFLFFLLFLFFSYCFRFFSFSSLFSFKYG